ncbi:MAG: rane protein, partial [Thermoleophilaceae bacterium]|nr:rane protein [Thermoleophilaceae bacterium]
MATATPRPQRAEVASAIGELVRSFNERNLLTWASALSFQVVTAIVPFLLFALALIGFLNIENVWTDIADNIKPHISGPAFHVVESTAKKVLTTKQGFWLTLGFGIAIWEMSGGIRAIMGGLAEIYAIEETRPWKRRMRTSFLLAIAVSVLVIVAIGVTWLGPLLYGDVGQPLGTILFLARWLIAASLLWLAVALTVHYAPDADRPVAWVSAGTTIVVIAWSLMSILFGLYI